LSPPGIIRPLPLYLNTVKNHEGKSFHNIPNASDDERLLASLGYKQELKRSWSAFSNFAISFSMISILSGCFTTFAQAWNNGGPVAISLGWPLISAFILIIGLCMAELASAYPTSGGIYWWASKLGGPKAGFFAGWLNLMGLLAVNASVVYGAATFLNITIGVFSGHYANHFLGGDYILQQFFWFVVIMILVTILNCFSSQIQAVLNNISVWWHVLGAAIIIGVLLFAANDHQDLKWVFTAQINNSGFEGGKMYWFYVLPLGFLLTQYTITGFDASAHLSEETQQASIAAANGLWKSIFYSAIGGYILLLAFLSVATKPELVSSFDVAINPYGAGSIITILVHALSPALFRLILLISTAGQIFCGIACLTSCSRMMFAFARDRVVPGHRHWCKVRVNKVPVNAVLISSLTGVIITLPALWKSPRGIPTAFYAVVSASVISLYLAFLIPIWLRWKMGQKFSPGEWNLGKNYKWMNIVAVVEIIIISFYFIMPFEPAAVPGNKDFTWVAVNYAPFLLGFILLLLWLWWEFSVKDWFKGPVKVI